MAKSVLCGDGYLGGGSGSTGQGYIFGTPRTATPGVAVSIRMRYSGAGDTNVKLSLYDASNNLASEVIEDTGGATDPKEHYFSTPVTLTSQQYRISATSQVSRLLYRTASPAYYYRTHTFSNSFPDPITWDGQSGSGYSIIVDVLGYAPPTVTSITGGNEITIDDTGIEANGTNIDDYSDSSVYTKVWITNNITWGSETIKVQQTWNSQTDTTINFDYADPLSELSAGIWYLHFETGYSQTTGSAGLAFTLSSGSSIPTAGATNWTNAAQTFSGAGHSIASGQAVSLVNAAQTISASGYSIPTGQASDFQIAAQLFYAEGYAIPSSAGVALFNPPQTFYGTGYIVVNIPTSAGANWVNAAQVFSGSGFAIPVSSGSDLVNAAQTIYGTGFSIASGETVSFSNGAQVFNATGFSIPVSGAVDLVNAAMLFYGYGTTAETIEDVTTTVYAADILMAQEMIAEAGRLVTWRQLGNPVSGSSTYDVSSQPSSDYSVYMVFFPVNSFSRRYIQAMTGSEIQVGNEYGLMAASSEFIPKKPAYVIAGTETKQVVTVDKLAPNGERILYRVELGR